MKRFLSLLVLAAALLGAAAGAAHLLSGTPAMACNTPNC